MLAAERLRLVERTLLETLAELAAAKAQVREWEQQSGRWKVGYEQMAGQIVAQTECANSLRRAEPEAWEAHFSKRAKKSRKMAGGQPHNFINAEMPAAPAVGAA